MTADNDMPVEDNQFGQAPAGADELSLAMQKVQEAMMVSETGKRVIEASDAMMQKGTMVNLMQVMENTSVPEQTRMLLGQYMGQMMNQDPANGLSKFATYLQKISEDPQQAPLKDYYLDIKENALKLHNEAEYKVYVEACKVFDEDNSAEAETARAAGAELQGKIQALSSSNGSANA